MDAGSLRRILETVPEDYEVFVRTPPAEPVGPGRVVIHRTNVTVSATNGMVELFVRES